MIEHSGISEPTQLKPGSYLSNDIYTDQGTFQRELSDLYHSSWLFACHESELPATGSFRLVETPTASVIVCRDTEGRLRAFLNTCRHRGAEIVRTPSGNLRAFQCLYHLWTYSLGGELMEGADLVGVPKSDGYAATPFNKEDFPLVEVDLGVLRGLIFISLTSDHPALEDYLGEAADVIREWVPEGMEVFHIHRTEIASNWKLFCDGNRELYHVLLHYLNRKSSAYAGQKADDFRWRILENGHMAWGDSSDRVTEYQHAGYDGDADELQDHPIPGHVKGSQVVLNLFPDVMINFRGNALRIDRMIPKEPGRTIVEWRGLGMQDDSPEVRRIRQRSHNLVWGPFGRNLSEDVAAVESQWAKMAEGISPWSIIAREEESRTMDDISMREFYAEWARRMRQSPYVPAEGEGE